MSLFRHGAGKASWVALLSALAMFPGCRSKRALLPRGEGAAVVVVSSNDEAAAADPSSGALAEAEPNNSPGAPQTLSFSPAAFDNADPRLEVSISGSLSAPTDVDVFRLVLDPGQVPIADAGQLRFALSLQVAPAAQSPEALRIEVLQGDASLLRASVQEEALRVPNLPLAPQVDLIVRVARVKPKGELPLGYLLRAQARPLSAAEEAEPNGTIEQATPVGALTATTELVGHLGWRQDTDWFAVTFPSGLKENSLSLELQVPEGGVAEVGFADAQGVLQHGYTRASGGVLTLRHVKPPAVGNVAYVRVHNAGPAVFEPRYRLSVIATPADPGVEQEPNNLLTQAQALTSASVRGTIHPAGDEDTFKVCGPQVGSWQIRPPKKLSLEVSVIEVGGKVISQQTYDAPGALLLPPESGAVCNFIQIREKSHKRSNALNFYELLQRP